MSIISSSTTSTTAYKVTADTTGTLVLQTGSTPTTAVTVGTDQSVTLAGTLAVQGQTVSPYTGFKNRIINGGMMIDQRNAGASVTPTNSQYLVDRFWYNSTQASKVTIQQSSVAPTGFTNSLLVTSSSSYAIAAGDVFGVVQPIEGYNVADLGFGTASASTVTISFWVRSSLIGTFGGSVYNNAANRCYPFSYTISSANTWEQKNVTIVGDTTGTWLTNNSTGINVYFCLATGSTYGGTAGAWTSSAKLGVTGQNSLVGTNGATLYITGVQLEKGSTATSFDYRPYGTELQLCLRYYYRFGNATANNLRIALFPALNSTRVFGGFFTPVPMRSLAPSGTFGSGTYVVLENTTLSATYPLTVFGPYGAGSTPASNLYGMELNVASGLTAGSLYHLTILNGGTYSQSYVALDAEL